jgi:hypothetical protein
VSQDPKIDVEALIDRLVHEVGADELIRRIEARKAKGKDERKAKGKRGRPVGLKYQEDDQQLLLLAAALQIEWGKRVPEERLPTRFALLTKIVDLSWDYEACKIAGIPCNRPGPRKSSVVKRLMSRLQTVTIYAKDFPRGKVAIPLMKPPKGLDRGVVGFRPPPEMWENVHRLRPDLRLLP